MKKLIIALIMIIPNIVNAQVLINEIAWMGTDVSANDEWLELYNNSDESVDLSGWTLTAQDGAPIITLEGTIEPKSYFLLERTDDTSVPDQGADQIYAGALGNTGEWLILTDGQGNVIDEVNNTEDWTAGDNTTKQTMERIELNTWASSLEALGTPRQINSTTSQTPEENPKELQEDQDDGDEDTGGGQEDNLADKTKKGDITITEIFPNPVGSDTENEFIEIKNTSAAAIDITSWVLKTNNKQEYILPSIKFNPGIIITFYRRQTNLALNNDKEKLTLYNTTGKIISKVEYKNAPEDQSWQIDDARKYQWALPTPGQENNLEEIVLPTINITGPKTGQINEILSFDGSDSFDPLNRELKLFWDFGPRVDEGFQARNIYLQPGNYEIKLTAFVSQQASSTEMFKIKIIDEKKGGTSTSTPISTEIIVPEAANYDQLPYVFISELLPNPTGSDQDGEFIEIFNSENFLIDLTGWNLTDGAKTFTFANQVIKPGQYLAVPRSQSKIALNNDEDQLSLIAASGQTVDMVSYDSSKEGQSWVLDEKFTWQTSQTPSPGEINILDQPIEQPTTAPQVLGAQTEEPVVTEKPKSSAKPYIASGLAAIGVLGLGTILKLKK